MTFEVTHSTPADGTFSTAGALAWDDTHTLSMATGLLLGRGTAGTGPVEEITLGTNLTLVGTTLNATGGSMVYPGAGIAVSTGSAWDTSITPGTGVATALGVNVGSAGAFVTFNGALGTPSSGTLTNASGLPISTGVSGLGTGVATALAVNVGSAGALVVNGGALGTPSSGTLTNATGLPVGGISATGTPSSSTYLRGDGTWSSVSASPGGSSLTLQYNNAGSFAGMSGTSWDDTNRSLTITGATVTTSKPILDLSQTWNSGGTTFTAFKVNVTDTASASGSLLADFQVGGTSKFRILKDSSIQLSNNTFQINVPSSTTLTFGSSVSGFVSVVNGLNSKEGLQISNGGIIGWSDGGGSGNWADTMFWRDAAGVIAQRNGAVAQENRLYGSYASSTNYQRLSVKTVREVSSTLSGATYVSTATIPAYAVLVGVTTRVNTVITGATSYSVGDGTDADLWGANIGVAADSQSRTADFTAVGATGAAATARNVTLTANGSNFTGGVVEICFHYLFTEAD